MSSAPSSPLEVFEDPCIYNIILSFTDGGTRNNFAGTCQLFNVIHQEITNCAVTQLLRVVPTTLWNPLERQQIGEREPFDESKRIFERSKKILLVMKKVLREKLDRIFSEPLVSYISDEEKKRLQSCTVHHVLVNPHLFVEILEIDSDLINGLKMVGRLPRETA